MNKRDDRFMVAVLLLMSLGYALAALAVGFH